MVGIVGQNAGPSHGCLVEEIALSTSLWSTVMNDADVTVYNCFTGSELFPSALVHLLLLLR